MEYTQTLGLTKIESDDPRTPESFQAFFAGNQDILERVFSQSIQNVSVEDGKLVLTRFDESVEEISLPAGGGSSSATSVSLKNQGDTVYNVARGSKVELRILFTSTEDGQSTGTGAATITVNNAVKAASVPVANGTVTALDVTDYLSPGNNTVKVYCTDVYETRTRTLTYTVNVVSLSLDSAFDGATVYNGAIRFFYTLTGTGEKNVRFTLDGTELESDAVSDSGQEHVKTIPPQSHGVHRLTVQASETIDGSVIYSNTLTFDLLCVEEGNNAILISCPYAESTAAQGDLLTSLCRL